MDLKEYRRSLMEDPEAAAAHQRLRPKLELGRQILELRLERGWTQKELAKKAGTKQANISRLENALLNPSIEMLQKVANALGAELEAKIRSTEEITMLTDGLVSDGSMVKTNEEIIPVYNWPGQKTYPVRDDRTAYTLASRRPER